MRTTRRHFIELTLGSLLAAPARRATAAVGPKDRRLTSSRHGVTVEAPPGWTISEHTGYRETIALLLHPDGSRISVTVAVTEAKDPSTLAQMNNPGLALQGLTVSRTTAGPSGTVVVDASAPARQEAIRQIYLVRDLPPRRQAVILTLVCRASLIRAHAQALDLAFSRLGLEAPAELAGAARTAGGRGGSAGELRSPQADGGAAPQQSQQR